MITIYHGSTKIITKPELGLGQANNDYGQGFYCTQDLELAKEWACRTPHNGFANIYSLDTAGLRILNLEDGYHVLNWLAILLENRLFDISNPVARDVKAYILDTYLPPYRDYDVIIGFRADDSYFSFAKAFLNNSIPLSVLSEAMKLGKLGFQICLKSELAFSKLTYVGMENADGEEYFAKRMIRDKHARSEYIKSLENTKSADAVFAIDIYRNHWSNEDARLF